jgi:hypothetical protein
MQLTNEQWQAGRGGESVRVNKGGTDLAVVRADVFDRLRGLVYDDSPWTDEEMDRLAAEDADALGWEGMEVYQGDDP